MLKDITLGQYYPGDSPIHNLDPRVKIVATIIYVISLFLVKNVVGFAIVIGAMIAIVAVAKLPAKIMLKGVKAIAILLVITAICNLFFSSGDVVWQAGIFKITSDGIYRAVFYTLRLLLLVCGTSVMTLTTTPNKLTDGIESLLRPLNTIRIPVHEIAMMMSIALRFIPILGEEADKIKKAQMARGADFDEGKLMERIKALVPIMVPLFVSAFRRAGDLAMAMEARCYRGGENRTRMKPLRYTKADTTAYIVSCVFLIVVIFLG